MKPEALIDRVKELAVPVVEGFGLDLIEVEYTVERGRRILRLYIDKPGGVTIDDCSDVSNEFSTILDVEDLIHESYSLEVSSPGLDRPLTREKDFVRFAGRKVNLKTREPIDGRRNFKATIEGFEEGAVLLSDSEGRKYRIPIANIEKARLVAEI